jgi:hypothetical protein
MVSDAPPFVREVLCDENPIEYCPKRLVVHEEETILCIHNKLLIILHLIDKLLQSIAMSVHLFRVSAPFQLPLTFAPRVSDQHKSVSLSWVCHIFILKLKHFIKTISVSCENSCFFTLDREAVFGSSTPRTTHEAPALLHIEQALP